MSPRLIFADFGVSEWFEALGAVSDGSGVVSEGSGTLAEDSGAFAEGSGTIADGSGVVADGSGTFAEDSEALSEGSGASAEGSGAMIFVNRHTPNKSPEPTAVSAFCSAVAVHIAGRRWLSFFR
jgi:X-X-X-Leu-X-X-Gly heptad repeat protein